MKLGTRLRRAMRSLTATQPPKAKNIYTTHTPGTYYEGMDPDYRWFRQDKLARKTITTNAVFATQGGFQTIQEPPEEPLVKEKIDEINKRLNLDNALFVAQIKRSVYGNAAFEIVRDGEGYPTRLLSLQSTRIKPDIDENWSHTGYTYRGQKAFYRPEDVLYFTNLELESDRQGLSDLEPLRAVLEARHLILRENLPEIARTLWAPYVILKADTSGLPLDEAEIAAESYTAVSFDLWKNVVHIVVSDEAAKKAAHDVLSLNVEDAAKDLARMENKQIKETAEACTEKVSGTAYSDWGAMTTPPDSDTNPFEAIRASVEYIEGEGYEPDFMAMHPAIWGKFVTNTYVCDLAHAGIAELGRDGGQFTLPGYPTIKVYTDYALTQTPTASKGPLIGDSEAPALVLGEGPTEAAQYRDEKAGYDAYVIRQYLEPKLVIDDAIDKICT